MIRSFILLLFCIWMWSGPARAQYPQLGPVCDPITGCAAAISQTKLGKFDAYWLSDGKTQALVVPALGRVMSYGEVNGDNWLWNAPAKSGKTPSQADWRGQGGNKTWLAPQSEWPQWFGRAWPPWEGTPFQAEVLSGGKLHTVSAVSPASGTRIIRDYWHDEKTGDFVIEQSVQKVKGAPLRASIWSVTQIAPPDAVFLPVNPQSAYPNGFQRLDEDSAKGQLVWKAAGSLLEVRPGAQGAFKLGVDAPVAAIAAVKDGVAFVQKTARPDGEYPDAAPGATGFPVELFNGGTKAAPYVELELLSPLRDYVAGARWIHTMRWSLQQLPLHDVDSSAVHKAVERLLAPDAP
jgi:hypothetical protein